MRAVDSKGNQSKLLALQGEILSLEVPKAYAPGAPVELEVELEGSIQTLSGRTVECTRRGASEGMFRLRLRLVSLRREQRLALEQGLQN